MPRLCSDARSHRRCCMRAFHFVTEWSFRAPLERVFSEISACERYAAWWKGFEESEQHSHGLEEVVAHRVRGMFGMRLSFVQQRISREPPWSMQFSTRGDLVGEGVWKLASHGSTTNVTFTWDVDLGRRWLRALAIVPGVRALMTRSHDALMARGQACLAARVAGRTRS
jgi:uncharacterized protein YndB with AHSA1/START domain